MFENGLFIFRRDLRIQDNIGLIDAIEKCKNIYTLFIFTNIQITDKNKFKSNNAVQFMIESLDDLKKEIKSKGGNLILKVGENDSIIKNFIKKYDINAVFYNYDITPYAKKRDKEIEKICNSLNVELFTSQDYYLYIPGSILTSTNQVYTKFTPYYEQTLHIKVSNPIYLKNFKFVNTDDSDITIQEAYLRFTDPNPNILVNGGRDEALSRLQHLHTKTLQKYKATRNDLGLETTRLSAYIKFGCISVREAYHAMEKNFGKRSDLIRQLVWREFYANILFAFPYVLTGPMRKKYEKMKWENNPSYLKAWENARTGFPIIDAAMTELNTTGYMHNRARLITASFLIKTLLINWQKGEKYFAQKLTDYDPASNNGNWQWVAGTGADSQPYFRIFNPWSQSENYDTEATYIKKWLPDLKDIPAKHLHHWNEYYEEYKNIDYPKPIVDYNEQRKKALSLYQEVIY